MLVRIPELRIPKKSVRFFSPVLYKPGKIWNSAGKVRRTHDTGVSSAVRYIRTPSPERSSRTDIPSFAVPSTGTWKRYRLSSSPVVTTHTGGIVVMSVKSLIEVHLIIGLYIYIIHNPYCNFNIHYASGCPLLYHDFRTAKTMRIFFRFTLAFFEVEWYN